MANVENAELLLRTVAKHLEAFEMSDWTKVTKADAPDGFVLELANITEGIQECGTTLCLAGFAGLLDGRKVKVHNEDPSTLFSRAYGERLMTPEEEEEGYADSWSQIAAEYLGLSSGLRGELFYTSNHQALAMLADLARGVDEKVILRSFYEGFYYRFVNMDLRVIAGY